MGALGPRALGSRLRGCPKQCRANQQGRGFPGKPAGGWGGVAGTVVMGEDSTHALDT